MLSGCALQAAVAAAGGSGESVTMMANLDDIGSAQIKQAQKQLGIKVTSVA